MSAPRETAIAIESDQPHGDLEAVFHAQYARIARVIARVTRDPARAEELAVEVFLKWWRSPEAHGAGAEAWLYRTAVRRGLDELRGQTRRDRYERVLRFVRPARTPEEIHAQSEERARVRLVLAALPARQAELLLLRADSTAYAAIAAALGLNPSSVGTLLGRAEQAFRKEYVKRYGTEK